MCVSLTSVIREKPALISISVSTQPTHGISFDLLPLRNSLTHTVCGNSGKAAASFQGAIASDFSCCVVVLPNLEDLFNRLWGFSDSHTENNFDSGCKQRGCDGQEIE